MPRRLSLWGPLFRLESGSLQNKPFAPLFSPGQESQAVGRLRVLHSEYQRAQKDEISVLNLVEVSF